MTYNEYWFNQFFILDVYFLHILYNTEKIEICTQTKPTRLVKFLSKKAIEKTPMLSC